VYYLFLSHGGAPQRSRVTYSPTLPSRRAWFY